MNASGSNGFFDFLLNLGLGYDDNLVQRMNYRHAHIVLPLLEEIKNARILDLGSHDGRWPFAYANAGAREVIGIEGRPSLIEQFDNFPDKNKDRIKLMAGDFVDGMDRLIAEGETFDIVSCLGVYYHTMEHYRIMCQMAKLKPKLIIIDSEFARSKEPIIRVSRENTASKMNATEQFAGQAMASVGYPSRRAVRQMAISVGYDLKFIKWDVPEASRAPVADYFGKLPNRIRMTCLLRPISTQQSA